jgi:predicted transcriptional regulator
MMPKHPWFYYKRKELGLTQKQLADKMYVSQSAISLAENFDYRYAEPLTIRIILKQIEQEMKNNDA